jgi:glutathione S-transferase
MKTITLYGTAGSLYTGKTRAYLIKAGIPYLEKSTSGEHYQKVVKPLAKTPSVPCIEFEDGQVIRDGTRIIDYFEAQLGNNFSPLTPKQKIVSRLFDVIGSEGLLRPAMHYRWDFPKENAHLVRSFFESMVPLHKDKKETGAKVMSIMSNAGKAFGAVEENFDVIEEHYENFLQKLDRHFSEYPYLLGGTPCIGDFGLMAAMYAHLGRDPKPLALMQEKAIAVFRWVERMNRPDADMGEFADKFEADYLAEDFIPETLVEVLKEIAIDLVPETKAAALCINDWLENTQPASETPVDRGVGFASFELKAKSINALAQPYRFFLLKRVQVEYEVLEENERKSAYDFLKQCNLTGLIEAKLNREINWLDNREVWA